MSVHLRSANIFSAQHKVRFGIAANAETNYIWCMLSAPTSITVANENYRRVAAAIVALDIKIERLKASHQNHPEHGSLLIGQKIFERKKFSLEIEMHECAEAISNIL